MDSETSNGTLPPVLAGQPLIFILPTHLPLDRLHDIESLLVSNGGHLTHDIAEAGVVLAKIGHKKRAVLELRARGVWTDEVPVLFSEQETIEHEREPKSEVPSKRPRTNKYVPSPRIGSEILDHDTESEQEVDGVRTRHEPSLHVKRSDEKGGFINILKLEWLEQSMAAGEALPWDSFVVYKGQKTKSRSTPTASLPSQSSDSKKIIRRAKEDAAKLSQASHGGLLAHGPKGYPSKLSSPRERPPLIRKTTSEDEDESSLPPPPTWVRDQVIYACLRSTPLLSPNERFISNLVKIRRIRELTLDEVGVRAYSTSIAAVAAYPYEFQRSSEVLALPGCDHKIANLFAEFQKNEGQNITAASVLESDPTFLTLNQFYQIWGVGAKTARDFFYHRGWKDLDDIVEQGWDSLSRVQQIGIKYYDEFQHGISREEAEGIARVIKMHANKVRPAADGNIECILVGGYRRGKEVSGDVDIILSHPDDSCTQNLVVDVVASLEKDLYITHTLSLHLTSSHRDQQTLPYQGDGIGQNFDTLDKALVVWQHPDFHNLDDLDNDTAAFHKKNPNIHRRVDIVISPWRTIGCAILGWSGDTTFQRDLRRYVKKTHGWRFDSTGIRDLTSGGQVVDLEHDGRTWQEKERLVMERLGIGWRPPNERCTR